MVFKIRVHILIIRFMLGLALIEFVLLPESGAVRISLDDLIEVAILNDRPRLVNKYRMKLSETIIYPGFKALCPGHIYIGMASKLLIETDLGPASVAQRVVVIAIWW